MSLRSCRDKVAASRHPAGKLPDDRTCGSHCDDFPACLPSRPPDVLSNVKRFLIETAVDGESQVAVISVLNELRDAITKGLARKNGDESERP